MLVQPILIIILLNYLRKSLRNSGKLPQWDKIISGGIIASAALIGLYYTSKSLQPLLIVASYAILAGFAYLVFTKKDFAPVKTLFYAFIPLIAVILVEDIVKIIDKSVYKNWKNYFETAKLFGFIWMGAMLLNNNKQRKALEAEKLRMEEKEKEFEITEKIKAELEVQVNERTAELTKQTEELQHALHELKSTQAQLIHAEKMASLGELTAGIAHEIQNPMNFVNNFSEVSSELIDELKTELSNGNAQQASEIAGDIKSNLEKISFHGKRADAIVKGMLQHSRTSTGQKELTDINALCDEYLRLSYHGLRAKDKSFNAKFETDFDNSVGKINVIPQEIGRVILNLINNAFYAVNQKQNGPATAEQGEVRNYRPTVTVSTRKTGTLIEIRVVDNGNGVPADIVDKIFQPFFTTKPTGQGTGLGLSLSYDIITMVHGGELKVESKEGEGTTFIIQLPIAGA